MGDTIEPLQCDFDKERHRFSLGFYEPGLKKWLNDLDETLTKTSILRDERARTL